MGMNSNSPVKYRTFATCFGWAAVAGRDNFVSRVVLPVADKAELQRALAEGIDETPVETKSDFAIEAEKLALYFTGEFVDFSFVCIDLSSFTPFQRRVWSAIRKIKYGEVKSYGWVARQINQPNASRAVGQTLGRNPMPIIIPCHRVIKSDGTLGGFGHGLGWKNRLLNLEQVWR